MSPRGPLALELGTLGLLLGVPLVFSTHLADAVLAPKQALFQLSAGLVVASWATQASSGAAPWRGLPRLLWWALALYLWRALGGPLHGLPPTSLPGTLDNLLLAGVLVSWSQGWTPDRARRWALYPLAAALLAGAYSHLQRARLDWVDWNHPTLSQDRTIATFGNPDYLASYLVAVLPLGLAWALGRPRARVRIAALALWAGVALAMVMTVTRGAWLGAAAATAVGLIGAARLRGGRALRGGLVGLGLAGLCLAGLVWAQGPGSSGMTVGARLASMTDLGDLSLRTRVFFWKAAAGMAWERPVAGVGPGGFSQAALAFRAWEPVETRFPARVPEHPHSQLFHVLAEAGLPGLVMLAAVLWGYAARGLVGLAARPEALPLLAAGAAMWVDHLFLTASLPVEILWVFMLAWMSQPLSLAQDQPGPPARPPTSRPSRLVPLAAAALVAALAWAGLTRLASEWHTWRGEGERVQARALGELQTPPRDRLLARYQAALDHRLRAAELAPTWTRARAWWRVGQLYEELWMDVSGQQETELWAASVTAYQRSLEADPAFLPGRFALALALARRVETRPQALAPLELALAGDPRNPDYRCLKAQLATDLGLPGGGLKAWEEILAIHPGIPTALLGAGAALCEAGRHEEGERRLLQAAALDPRREAEIRGRLERCPPGSHPARPVLPQAPAP